MFAKESALSGGAVRDEKSNEACETPESDRSGTIEQVSQNLSPGGFTQTNEATCRYDLVHNDAGKMVVVQLPFIPTQDDLS